MKTIKLASLKPNPANPRYITEEQFEALKRSIRDFPEMLALRPLVVDEQGMVLGGNMRLKALAELGHEDIPAAWVIKAKDLTEEQRREFIVKDNVAFGAWDWDALANDWADEPLGDWGLEVWRDRDLEGVFDDHPVEKKNEATHGVLTLRYDDERYKAITAALAKGEGLPEDQVYKALCCE